MTVSIVIGAVTFVMILKGFGFMCLAPTHPLNRVLNRSHVPGSRYVPRRRDSGGGGSSSGDCGGWSWGDGGGDGGGGD